MTTAEAPAPPQLETISIDVNGDIGTLTLNRPKVLNAMSPELIGELVTAAGWLADRATLRGLIVTGAGRAFSAGGDVTWFKRGLEESGEYLSADVRHGAENGDRRCRRGLRRQRQRMREYSRFDRGLRCRHHDRGLGHVALALRSLRLHEHDRLRITDFFCSEEWNRLFYFFNHFYCSQEWNRLFYFFNHSYCS